MRTIIIIVVVVVEGDLGGFAKCPGWGTMCIQVGQQDAMIIY
jgi:hypothetical protein